MSFYTRVLDTAYEQTINKTNRFIPMHLQIRAIEQALKVKSKLVGERPVPNFVEKPMPDVDSVPLDQIDLSNPFMWRQGKSAAYFKRIRDEDPVHYLKDSPFGPFWSVTRYDDIVFVDKNHELFSSEPIIMLGDRPEGLAMQTFIAMDPPRHDTERQAVQAVVAPKNLKEMEGLIRERTQEVLDSLPVDKPFDWVDTVSIELTGRMLATLLDYPYEDRRLLTYWSDVIAGSPEMTGGPFADKKEVFSVASTMAKSFTQLWHDKKARRDAGEADSFDLITLMQKNEDTKNLVEEPLVFMGNLALLIVGGNDTTRNSMTGGVLAMHKFPDQWEKLKAEPKLIPNMVSEIIRWQTPLAYMRRVAKQDVELGGRTIRKGDRVVMWYASGNLDERKIENPEAFQIDRKGARNHLSFGFGIHRCMGNRLAEMQLRILWEEMLARFDKIEVMSEPERVQSNFVRGYAQMMVKLTAKS